MLAQGCPFDLHTTVMNVPAITLNQMVHMFTFTATATCTNLCIVLVNLALPNIGDLLRCRSN